MCIREKPSILRTFSSFLNPVPLSLTLADFNHLWCFCPERYLQAFISVISLWIISHCIIKVNPIYLFKSLLINHKSNRPTNPLNHYFSLSLQLLPFPCIFLILRHFLGIYKNLEPKPPRFAGLPRGTWWGGNTTYQDALAWAPLATSIQSLIGNLTTASASFNFQSLGI